MIKSSPFGSTTLTGEDADRFIRHLKEDPPNPLAKAALESGKKMLKEFEMNGGFVILDLSVVNKT